MKLAPGAAVYPAVSVEAAREQCAILDGNFDEQLARLIEAATQSCEQYTRTYFAERSVVLYADAFPADGGRLDLLTHPVQSITSVAYDDDDNAEQTLILNTDYYADITGAYPFIEPVDSWPSTYDKPNAVRVTMLAGYATPDAIPAPIQHAILMRVAELRKNPEETFDVFTKPAYITTATLLAPYRRMVL